MNCIFKTILVARYLQASLILHAYIQQIWQSSKKTIACYFLLAGDMLSINIRSW